MATDKQDKALLYSLLIFPGAGHFYLKRNKSGALFAGVSLVALMKILIYSYTRAQTIVDQILSGQIPYDILLILKLVKQPPPGEAMALQMATFAVIAAWLGAAIDIYWRSKRNKQ